MPKRKGTSVSPIPRGSGTDGSSSLSSSDLKQGSEVEEALEGKQAEQMRTEAKRILQIRLEAQQKYLDLTLNNARKKLADQHVGGVPADLAGSTHEHSKKRDDDSDTSHP